MPTIVDSEFAAPWMAEDFLVGLTKELPVNKQYRYFCPNCAQGFHRRIGTWPKRCPGCRAALVLPSDSTGQCQGMLNFWVFNGMSWIHYEDFDGQLAAAVEELASPPQRPLTTKRIQ
jgi:hypothetical protein